MKYTIHGFSQEKALELGLDNNDLLILRWIVDFSQTNKMKSIYSNGKMYYWVNYKYMLEDIPILGMKKDTLYRRLKKMDAVGVLDHTTVKENGVYSYYGLGERYSELLGDFSQRSAYESDYEQESDSNPNGTDVVPNHTDSNPIGGTDSNPNHTDSNPEQISLYNNQSTRVNKSTKSSAEDEPKKAQKKSAPDKAEAEKMFCMIWELYPTGRKQGKPSARKSFMKALKDGVDPEFIKQKLLDYKKQIEIQGTELRYVKMGSTWFNGGWEDEYITDPAQLKGGKKYGESTKHNEDPFADAHWNRVL